MSCESGFELWVMSNGAIPCPEPWFREVRVTDKRDWKIKAKVNDRSRGYQYRDKEQRPF